MSAQQTAISATPLPASSAKGQAPGPPEQVAGAAAARESELIRPSIAMEPRGLTRCQAAAYAGCQSLSTFNDWIRRGILPGPIPRTHTWDRRAIDAALDRLSGLQATLAPSPLEEWKARRRAHRA